MKISTLEDYRKAVRQGPYAWPGGYPLYWITADGGVLSWKVGAEEERRNVIDAITNEHADDWRIVAVEINYEDAHLVCDHSNEQIESAYTPEPHPSTKAPDDMVMEAPDYDAKH